MKTLLNEQEISWLKENYYSLGASGCSQYLNKTPLQIRTFIKSRRLKLLASKEAKAKPPGRPRGKNVEDYKVDPRQFFNVVTPEVAYILGLLWADGYIYNNDKKRAYKVVLETQYEDAIIFQKILSKTGEWPFYKRARKKMKEQGRSVCFNEPLVRFLTENDYLVKSDASADKILEKIPRNLRHYWFRGLIDGDGGISKRDYTVSIYSSLTQKWDYMEALCKELDIKSRISKKETDSGNASSFHISSMRSFLIFLDYVYQGYPVDKIGLERKYLIYKKNKDKIPLCKRKTTWLKNQMARHQSILANRTG